MLQQVLLALLLSGATVVVHTAGTVYVVVPLAGFWNQRAPRLPARSVMLLARLVSLLLLLHLLEMTLWAVAYVAAGVFTNFETALYFSLKSYTTVGYGDVLPPVSWRLLGPLEAAVGVLMLGFSTSVIIAAVQRLYNLRSEEA